METHAERITWENADYAELHRKWSNHIISQKPYLYRHRSVYEQREKGKKLEEIASPMGISRERVRQLGLKWKRELWSAEQNSKRQPEPEPDYSTKPTVSKSLILSLLSDRPIAYHPILARALGGVKQAVFVSQLLYWTGKGKRTDGFIWKSQEEWTEETGLSAGEQRTARKHLVKSGVLQEQRKGIPARLYYRLNTDALQTRLEEYYEQDIRNPNNKEQETPTTIPEITTETTPEREEPPAADSPADEPFYLEGETPTAPMQPHSKEEIHTLTRRAVQAYAQNGGNAGVADPTQDVDPWEDRPVREWCAFIRLPYSEQSPGRKRMLAADLRSIATSGGMDKTPQEAGEAIRKMSLSKSCQWLRSAGRPTHKEFTNVLTNVLCGQTLPEGRKANGGSSTPRQDPAKQAALEATFNRLFDADGMAIRR